MNSAFMGHPLSRKKKGPESFTVRFSVENRFCGPENLSGEPQGNWKGAAPEGVISNSALTVCLKAYPDSNLGSSLTGSSVTGSSVAGLAGGGGLQEVPGRLAHH